MAKRHSFKKTKPGEPIPVTARQLESFMLEHNGKFNSRDYDKFERMDPNGIARSRRGPRIKYIVQKIGVEFFLDTKMAKYYGLPEKHYKNIQNCYVL